jgi:adenylate cyclase
VAADIVGFSRLVGIDELGTLAELKAHRAELIDDCVAKHNGRIFKLTGDGMLVEFSSVVNALACAREIQRGMRLRNAAKPGESRVEFRIGINLGDVVVEEGDILGDGVNVASRIETVARPGGIAVSAVVREQVGNRTDAIFDDAGELALKNIDRPVRIFHVSEPASILPASAVSTADRQKPSIAVLPFENMSGDKEQEYFSDGITEDIITDLSKLSGLRVIARNSVFTYKNRAVDVQEVSRRFAVGAVLEGSIRKSGQRVRITAQLIDGNDGSHLWAERYDRDLVDIFEIQDEITKKIVEQLRVRMLPHEKVTISGRPTSDLQAYDLYLQARNALNLRTRQSLNLARTLFNKAIELDPLFARAFAGIADANVYLRSWHGEEVFAASILAASGYALTLDESLAEAHTAKGYAFFFAGRNEDAANAFEHALAKDPGSYDVCLAAGLFYFSQGDFARAKDLFERASTLNPEDFRSANLFRKALVATARTEAALAAAGMTVERATAAIEREPDNSAALQIGACGLAASGMHARAIEWIERAIRLDPDDNNTRFNAACTQSVLGNIDAAASVLADYLRPLGEDEYAWCRHDPDLAPLREHPAYKNIFDGPVG